MLGKRTRCPNQVCREVFEVKEERDRDGPETDDDDDQLPNAKPPEV
jgi:hypothetical protein